MEHPDFFEHFYIGKQYIRFLFSSLYKALPEKESALKRKNLLLQEQILSFES